MDLLGGVTAITPPKICPHERIPTWSGKIRMLESVHMCRDVHREWERVRQGPKRELSKPSMPSLLILLFANQWPLQQQISDQLMTITTRMDFHGLSVLKLCRYYISSPESSVRRYVRDCPLAGRAHTEAADLCRPGDGFWDELEYSGRDPFFQFVLNKEWCSLLNHALHGIMQLRPLVNLYT